MINETIKGKIQRCSYTLFGDESIKSHSFALQGKTKQNNYFNFIIEDFDYFTVQLISHSNNDMYSFRRILPILKEASEATIIYRKPETLWQTRITVNDLYYLEILSKKQPILDFN